MIITVVGQAKELAASSEGRLVESRWILKILTLEEAQRRYIIKVLKMTGWRVKGHQGAAEILDLPPSTLYSKMKKLGIKHPRRILS